jgi:site-specific recombinase XerD
VRSPNTADNVKLLLKKFVREACISRASGLTVKTLDKWLGKLKAEGKSQETLRSYVKDIKVFAKYLAGRWAHRSFGPRARDQKTIVAVNISAICIAS